jgi:hypothetical protein
MVSTDKSMVDIYVDSFTKALTLVVALAWNSAFSGFFKNTPGLKDLGPWLYAFIVTALVVFLLLQLNKFRPKLLKLVNKYSKKANSTISKAKNMINTEEVEEISQAAQESNSEEESQTTEDSAEDGSEAVEEADNTEEKTEGFYNYNYNLDYTQF